jgi:hypothetical protein
VCVGVCVFFTLRIFFFSDKKNHNKGMQTARQARRHLDTQAERVAKLVKALDCGPRAAGFDPHLDHNGRSA